MYSVDDLYSPQILYSSGPATLDISEKGTLKNGFNKWGILSK